jgi:predicted nucleotidyltransferase
MLAVVEQKQPELATLCRKHSVRTLELFGSAATADAFDPERSDLDFLIEFALDDARGPADQYFGLREDLQRLFQRDVDLVTVRSLRNPYFIRSVNRTRRLLYAS